VSKFGKWTKPSRLKRWMKRWGIGLKKAEAIGEAKRLAATKRAWEESKGSEG
jgi:hypothetical protein